MNDDTGTIQMDVQNGFDGDDDADSIVAMLQAKRRGEDPLAASTTAQGEGAPDRQDDDGTTQAAEENEGGDNTDAEAQEEAKQADPDDAEVEVKVGEETKKVTIRDLKRLYGQEASLTQKSQKLAEAQREAAVINERANAALAVALDGAQKRLDQYKDFDWLVLSQRMGTDDFQALRQDFLSAQAEVATVQQEVDKRLQETRQQVDAAYRAQAQEAIKVLSDPQTGIKDFGPALYNEMVAFGKAQGLEGIHTVVNPVALKLLHKAMLYDRQQAAAAAAKTKVEKAVNQAQRVLKPTTSTKATTPASSMERDAFRRAKESDGSLDDVAALLAARRKARSSD